MRIATPGVRRLGPAFQLSFEGRAIDAWPGESLAAALLSAGILDLRVTAAGEPRGLYCGMGVCGECRVEVDGAVRRACMTAAAPGQRLARAGARAAPRAMSSSRAGPPLDPDLLIVGAGPAGLSAARVAASAGLSVLVADERKQAGGQYFKQPGLGFDLSASRLDGQFGEGRTLATAARSAGAEFLPGATLWAANMIDGAPELHLLVGETVTIVRPRRLILAVGAFEKPWPVPGWTLPGVMTSGAAQTLLRAYQTAPGRRVLIAGNGPLNLQVARELQRAGVEVVALVEQAPRPGPAQAPAALRMVVASPKLVRDGVAQLAALRAAGVPLLYRHVLTAVEGEGRARRAIVARIGADHRIEAGSERGFDVDAVCLGYGFLPQSEAARALGCAFAGESGDAAVRDGDCRSSVAPVFIAGDGGGLGGARVAIAQGIAAGAAAARDLGAAPDAAEQSRARRALTRHRAFQTALWSVYSPASVDLALDAQTAICRCESVTAGVVAQMIADDLRDIGSLKRAGRIGMGACQGRYCGPLIAARLADREDGPPPGFAPRPPFKPIPISAIAGAAPEVTA